ncbi:Protein arginine methyltransferase-like protein, mitochondrial [Lachnellula subtilissima]|uniref:Protein arginine methyltransferase NDUFAF7 n=1 Tax=Lachnellula subtilissima TaxID=602034 RepID=A0A8H8RE83_9HELO|nr:Protein arginine methyltransferase-like protein, mitochondrial [Lachnellula subtilissima]
MAVMRSIVSVQTRNILRGAVRGRYGVPCAAVRWSSSEARQWSTPLAKQLSEAITATGPIPLASFMRMCLTSDVGGYYTSKQEGRDQFGQKGDFITSPEISQIFGELIGVWFVAEWMAQGKKSKGVELVEIGPGRGTLMDDMLRTIRNFKPMASSIEAVYLVEASPALREAQKQLLCGDAPMTETSIGHQSTSKYANIPIIWTENIRFVPSGEDKTPFIVAHEFFDALPIHAFQSVAPTPTPQETTINTPTGEHALTPSAQKAKAKQIGPQWREMSPEFQLTLSKSSTPHSLYLPEVSPRYKALKSTPGSLIEVSPESHAYAAAIASLIGKPSSGAALILDYGPADTIPINSLRGIKSHKRVSPLSEPGLVDLSADVDFVALAEAACKATESVEVWGPVEQGGWLEGMGIRERAEMLGKELGEKEKGRIESACQRLVERGGGGMGKVYKVLAIVPESGGRRRPVGFGGGVEE